MNTQNPLTIEQAAQAVAEATDNYNAATTCVSIARNRECDALNTLNRAQAALDEVIASMRKQAPRDTDWKRNARDVRADET